MKKIIPAIIFVLIIGFVVYLKSVYSVPVLMYHRIDTNGEESRLSVAPKSFERQMDFLKQRNYQFLTLGEYIDLLKSGKKPEKKSVVITFDDGYADNYTAAYPVLKKYGIPATIFVVVDWVGKKGMISWPQLEELSNSVLIEIANHSLTHRELQKLDTKEVVREIKESKHILESRLGKRVDHFCYPCGFFNSLVKETLKTVGYKGACATHPGKEIALDDVFAIRRIRISRSADNLFIFWVQVSGYYTFFKDRRIKKNEENTCY